MGHLKGDIPIMSTSNRFAEGLNRGAQAATREPDFIKLLMFVRNVSHKNVDPQTKRLVLSTGRRTQDCAFTCQAQYLPSNCGGLAPARSLPGIGAPERV